MEKHRAPESRTIIVMAIEGEAAKTRAYSNKGCWPVGIVGDRWRNDRHWHRAAVSATANPIRKRRVNCQREIGRGI
jgi:hypothetical protein